MFPKSHFPSQLLPHFSCLHMLLRFFQLSPATNPAQSRFHLSHPTQTTHSNLHSARPNGLHLLPPANRDQLSPLGTPSVFGCYNTTLAFLLSLQTFFFLFLWMFHLTFIYFCPQILFLNFFPFDPISLPWLQMPATV